MEKNKSAFESFQKIHNFMKIKYGGQGVVNDKKEALKL
jgi:hypothetical protein